MKRLLSVLVVAIAWQWSAGAALAAETLAFSVRGKTLTLTVYRPAAGVKPKGTFLMGSGDVGWVGLAAEMSEFLASHGYNAVGINVRQYLAAFTSGKTTLTTREPPADYAQMAAFLRERNLLVPPVFVSGVSEGAAMAVLAAASDRNHEWINGVMTMGLPPTAELGWRWSDFTTWISKKDPDEPMFAPGKFLPQVAPIPICLIHSSHDEYVTETDYRLFEATARSPKKFVLINASNHRFTDRKDELKQQVLACIEWMRAQQPPPGT